MGAKMKRKGLKIWLILIVSVILSAALLHPASAADNSYAIRISCTIPALPGQNMPILQEQRIANIKVQASTPVMFQKNTQETRTIQEKKSLVDLQTLYNR